MHEMEIVKITTHLHHCSKPPRYLGLSGRVTTPAQAYEFDIQPYDKSDEGDTSQWVAVVRDATHVGPRELVVATGLSPSSRYRFRVRARQGDRLSPASAISEVFTTGERVVPVQTTDAPSDAMRPTSTMLTLF